MCCWVPAFYDAGPADMSRVFFSFCCSVVALIPPLCSTTCSPWRGYRMGSASRKHVYGVEVVIVASRKNAVAY